MDYDDASSLLEEIERHEQAAADGQIIITTPDGTEIYAPANKLGKLDLPITEEDLEPLKEDDEDFPADEARWGIAAPAAHLKRIPKSVVSDQRQARLLAWTESQVRTVNRQTGIYIQLPAICKGTTGCVYAQNNLCPVENRDSFIGKNCPLELLEIFKHFSGYIKDLSIEPEDYTNIQLIADLCRLHLTLWRTDMNMRIQPEISSEIGVIAQKTGEAFYRETINKNRELQAVTRESIQKVYRSLIATKESKARLKTGDTGSITISDLIDQHMKRSRRKSIGDRQE